MSTSQIPPTASTVERGITVQDFLPIASPRNTDPIIGSRHWGEITDNEHEIPRRRTLAQQTDHAGFSIVTIDPLEAGGINIMLVQCRLRPVQPVQIRHPTLQ